jgi:hypothetical protein
MPDRVLYDQSTRPLGVMSTSSTQMVSHPPYPSRECHVNAPMQLGPHLPTPPSRRDQSTSSCLHGTTFAFPHLVACISCRPSVRFLAPSAAILSPPAFQFSPVMNMVGRAILAPRHRQSSQLAMPFILALTVLDSVKALKQQSG